MKDLKTHLYGNPHSQNPSSQLSADAVDGIRELVLQHFNTDSSHYDVIFTSGCTAALKLLAESFPWSAGCKMDPETAESAGSLRNCEETGSSKDNVHRTGPTGITNQASLHRNSSLMVDDLRTNPQCTEVLYLSDTIKKSEDAGTGKDLSFVIDNGSSIFCYLEDNHTSVVGMRESARHHGARIVCTTAQNVKTNGHRLNTTDRSSCIQKQSQVHLFAYPAQSNFSGQKYPLSWTRLLPSGEVHISGLEHLSGQWMTVLDAASHVCTSPLDLTSNPAHFVALSFYKMFGYPTGLGALLVRNDCVSVLHKDYYGGGTVLATVSRTGLHVPRPQLHERYSVECV